LDPEYLSSPGQFDVVYSWGVLHHSGKYVARLGEFGSARGAWWEVIHRNLQRPGHSVTYLESSEGTVQPWNCMAPGNYADFWFVLLAGALLQIF